MRVPVSLPIPMLLSLAVGLLQVCQGISALTPASIVDHKPGVNIGSTNAYQLLPLVFALSKSLIESRADDAQLEERVARLEEIMTDVAPDSPPRIFFAVRGEGVKAYSWATNDAIIVKRSGGYNDGVAYDSIRQNLYWSSNDTIYRGSRDGTEVEVVFKSFRYGIVRGLAHDWVTGNLYGVSNNGIVFVCNTSSSEQLDCEVLVSGLKDLFTIALNPLEGKMYWTTGSGGTIIWAEMDGSGSGVLVSGLSNPRGITIDFGSSRLYWAEHGSSKIQSSDLKGKNVRAIFTGSANSNPWGIATLSERAFWSSQGTQKLYSVTKAGEDARTLYEGVEQAHQVVLATSNLPRNRTNHCENYSCSHICVLTASQARCLDYRSVPLRGKIYP